MAQVLDELLVAIGIDTDELIHGAEGAADEVEGSLKGINTAAAGALVGGLFTAGLDNAIDATKANTKLTNQLGLTQGEAQKAGDSAGRVFSAGFGESLDDVNEALGDVAQNMGGVGKVSDDALDQMTKDAIALSDTFEFDVGASAQAAGNLVKTGLAKNGTDAFDLITAAAQKLPPALREELPDVINEYSEYFDQLGFTGPQMMGLLAKAAQDPTFQIDKLGDAVKEFTLQIGNTSAVSAPLKSLGLDVGKIQKEINTGHGTKAFDEVTTALKNVDDQTKRTQLQAALFGGPGEDMGNSLLNLGATGADAATGMDHAAGAAKNVTDSVGASASIDSIWRTLATTIGDQLAPALQIFSNFMKENPGLVQALAPILLTLAVGIGIAAAAQWVWNAALFAWPGTWIIAAILAVIVIIVLIATKTTWFQTAWNTVWGAVKTAFSATVDFIIKVASYLIALPAEISNWFGEAKDWAILKLVQLVTWVSGLPHRITSALSRLATDLLVSAVMAWTRFSNAAHDKADSLIGYVKGIPGRIKSGLGSLGSLLTSAGRSIIQGLINGVTGMIGSLQRRFSSITNMIPDWKGPMTLDLKLLTPSGAALMNGLMGGIDDQVPALHKQLAGITSDISTTVVPGNVTAGARASGPQQGQEQRVVLDIQGGNREMRDLLRKIVQTDGRGNVQTAFGDGRAA